MRILSSFFTVSIFWILSPMSAFAVWNFEVRAEPISNLVYQLDCMTDIYRCSTDVYHDLWQKKLQWTAQDQEYLLKWKQVREKYRGEIKLDQPAAKPFALPWSGPLGIQLGDKFSIATYHAQDRRDLRTRLEALVSPQDMESIDSVIERFERRFFAWWKHSAKTRMDRLQRKLAKKVNQVEVRQKIEEFAAFYEARLPKDYSIYLHLFYRPSSEKRGSFATVFDNHAAIEVLPSEPVGNVLDVVTHELCHFFHSAAPEEKKRRLVEAFANSESSISIPTHNILNEALATAFGNGIAGELWMDSKHYLERSQKERGFYNDTAIDSAAKALIPILKRGLAQRSTLFSSDFPQQAMGALQAAMPNLIHQPARLLTELVAIYEPAFESVVRTSIRRKLRGGFYSREGIDKDSSWEMTKTYPRLNLILFLSSNALETLKKHEEVVPSKDRTSIKGHFRKQSSFVYAIQRGPATYTFIVAGNTPEDIERQFNRLLDASTPFSGALE